MIGHDFAHQESPQQPVAVHRNHTTSEAALLHESLDPTRCTIALPLLILLFDFYSCLTGCSFFLHPISPIVPCLLPSSDLAPFVCLFYTGNHKAVGSIALFHEFSESFSILICPSALLIFYNISSHFGIWDCLYSCLCVCVLPNETVRTRISER